MQYLLKAVPHPFPTLGNVSTNLSKENFICNTDKLGEAPELRCLGTKGRVAAAVSPLPVSRTAAGVTSGSRGGAVHGAKYPAWVQLLGCTQPGDAGMEPKVPL